MSGVGLVLAAGLRNNLRLKTTLVIMASTTLICLVGIAVIFYVLLLKPELATATLERTRLEGALGIIVYVASFLGVGIMLNSFALQSMVREKARGNLQALLATPLRVVDIWLGKSLSIFLPGMVLGIVLGVLVLVIVNVAFILPVTDFVVTPWMLVSSFIAVPLVYLFMGMLVHLVGLTSKAATGNVIAQVFLPVMINVMIQITVRNTVNAGSWLFLVINLGLAAVLGIIVLVNRSRLTTEAVVLSN